VRELIGLLSVCLVVAAAAPVQAQSPVERGRYLSRCWAPAATATPRRADRRPARKAPRRRLRLEDEGLGAWITPNITPDPETGIGRWTDEEVIRAIREGRGRDGKTLGSADAVRAVPAPRRQ
jgi:hypothetical protein